MTEEAKTSLTAPTYTMRVRVRYSDADVLGHVNNAVYLTYAMEAAFQHADSAGFTVQRMRDMGGIFVVRKTEIEYHRPAMPGDELLVTTTLTTMRGVRANRATAIVDAATGQPVAHASTDYVWVTNSGRPARIPAEAMGFFDL